MARFSANLGFLWTELALPEAIAAAAAAGFDAVESHWPYEVPAEAVKRALDATGLEMQGLNTSRGNVAAGDMGLCALPGREAEARAAIDEAIAYAVRTGTRNVHVMAGIAGTAPGAPETYLGNLAYAARQARPHGIGILIEPLNHRDAPGYFLNTSDAAARIIAELGEPDVRMMFDCYHVQIMEGDLSRRLERHLPLIGHIQIAAVPSRYEPDEGEVAYERLVRHIDRIGYGGFIGAEYRPRATTEDGLGWLEAFRRSPG
jgi:hydroxypyruvate isomerase